MNSMKNHNKTLIGKRSQLYRRLFKIRDILPGSFSSRKIQCGKVNCSCNKEGKEDKDGKGGKGGKGDKSRWHTAYQHSYKIEEKQVTRNIPKQYARQVEKQVLDNKEFKKIMNQIHKINLEILFQQIADSR